MATEKRDYYEILGVTRNASEAEVKRAFRRKARECHPDVSQDHRAEAQFKELNEAYEVLSDAQKRRMYDQFGHVDTQGFAGAGGMGGFAGFGFENIFESFFGTGMGRSAARSGPQRGADLRYHMSLSFEEAVFGCERTIELDRLETCPKCGGTGAEPGTQPERCAKCNGTGEMRYSRQSILGSFVNVATCDRCRGEGRVLSEPCGRCKGAGSIRQRKRLVVSVPGGVDDGAQVRLTGEGEVGSRGGPRGNLYVHLGVAAHSVFSRQGNDLLCEVAINFTQAALGDLIAVPTLGGNDAELRIPAGTQSGSLFPLRGKGVPRLDSSRRGDQYVRVIVRVPSPQSAEQRELLLKLSQTYGLSVEPQDDRGILGRVKNALGVD